jgi:hypothetical protein
MPLKFLDVSSVVRSPEEVDRLFPWLRSDLLRAIPHFISPAWTSDRSRFDAAEYAKTWKRIGFDSATLLTVHHDGYYLYPSEFTQNKPDRDYFGEQVDACAKEGIRSIAYYSLTLNSLVGGEHPEWRIRDLHDRVLVPDHRYFFHYDWLCVNSPFRDFAIAQIMEIVARYPVDAVWLDILYLPPHPSASFLEPGQDTCFCGHCHRAYARFFQGENLFDAVGSPRHDEFRAESYRRFLFDLKTAMLSAGRPLALTFNGAGRRRGAFYDRVDEIADWCSGEAHSITTRSIFSKVLTQDSLPMELMSCSELTWSHNVSKPTHLVKLEALNTLLHGGTYTLGINHAPDGRLQQGNIERLVEWGAWIKKMAPKLREGKVLSEVGILEAGQPLLNNGGNLVRWTEFLAQGHFLFSIERNLETGKWPRCMVVPHELRVDAKIAECLHNYVREGGRLLVEGPLARAHGSGSYILEGLLGVQAGGMLEGHAFYLQPGDGASRGLIPDEPVYFQCGKASIMRNLGGTVLADLVPQFADKQRLTDIQIAPNYPSRPDQGPFHPGAVLNSYGKGAVLSTALALTCPNGEKDRHPWPRILAGNLVRHLLGGRQAVDFPGHEAVEVVAKQGDGPVVLHFLNHYYDAGDFIPGVEENLSIKSIPIALDNAFFGIGDTGPAKRGSRGSAACGVSKVALPDLGVYGCVTVPRTGRSELSMDPALATGQ